MSRLAEKVLRGLSDVGYHGSLLNNKEKFDVALELGQKSVEFTKIVNYLTNEIRSLAGIDEEVNAIDSPEDSVSFVMEVTSFLKELNCPYSSLTQGLVSERLQNVSDRLLLLDYLVTELMAVRILQEKKPEKKIELKLQETPEGADMRQILQTLRFPKPPPNITIKQLFDKLDTTVPLVLNKAGADLIGSGLFNGHLSDKQWEILNGVQSDLHKEYKIRREMLLTRLDVTIQSFQWSERTKGKEDKFEKAYFDKRTSLKVEPDVSISDLIAARTDLAIIEKTSNSHVRKNTQSLFQKVVIGQVPDRGGRSWEQPPPPPEMPSWQQNRTAGPPARGGGGQGNRGGGQSNRGGGQSNRGGYQGGGGGGSGYNSRDNSGDRGSYQSNYQNQGGGYKSAYGAGSNQSFGRGGGGYGGNYGNYNRGDDSYGRSKSNPLYLQHKYSRRDSGGGSSYGGNQDYGQNKRPKTYDSYQPNKNTYADQYVQERDHNQQYHRGRGGRGRSNYHRGGGGNYH